MPKTKKGGKKRGRPRKQAPAPVEVSEAPETVDVSEASTVDVSEASTVDAPIVPTNGDTQQAMTARESRENASLALLNSMSDETAQRNVDLELANHLDTVVATVNRVKALGAVSIADKVRDIEERTRAK